MPCTAKKYEIARPEMQVENRCDVDAVFTTRELARMIKEIRVDFLSLKDENFDDPFGYASGAGAIFGASGGVIEAALRTVAEKLTVKPLENVNFKSCRGQQGIKEFTVELPNLILKGAVVNGMGNTRKILNKIRNKEADYHFIEIMGCPGGCVMGGGQPIIDSEARLALNVFSLRSSILYNEDKKQDFSLSHKNPAIIKLYEEYLGEPNSEKAHHLLHTNYQKRDLYKK